VFWKGGETVLAVSYNAGGCADFSRVLTLEEFEEISGLKLA